MRGVCEDSTYRLCLGALQASIFTISITVAFLGLAKSCKCHWVMSSNVWQGLNDRPKGGKFGSNNGALPVIGAGKGSRAPVSQDILGDSEAAAAPSGGLGRHWLDDPEDLGKGSSSIATRFMAARPHLDQSSDCWPAQHCKQPAEFPISWEPRQRWLRSIFNSLLSWMDFKPNGLILLLRRSGCIAAINPGASLQSCATCLPA